MTIDITAMRASLSAFTGYGAVEVESYRQDVGALLDALEAANAEIEHLRATVAALRASVPPVYPSDYGHEVWSTAIRDAVAAERAAVVAWLRNEERYRLANAIERGEHGREEEK